MLSETHLPASFLLLLPPYNESAPAQPGEANPTESLINLSLIQTNPQLLYKLVMVALNGNPSAGDMNSLTYSLLQAGVAHNGDASQMMQSINKLLLLQKNPSDLLMAAMLNQQQQFQQVAQQQPQVPSPDAVNNAYQQMQMLLLHQHFAQQNNMANMELANNYQEPMYGASSISASPMVNSDSDMTEFTIASPDSEMYHHQVPMHQELYGEPSDDRIRSPPFKDPHQIADPETSRLLNAVPTDRAELRTMTTGRLREEYALLTVDEQIAVTGLCELASL
ncbi:unnamed protein product [Caenorhabditis bovis]|uniref:Uncharacterized protein n=1 Tax=Caenorhabditis bovis TaxID=2654633 RepID=A0A8S1FB03_9PELO|nr:unnamed protein product [Caenorhabditis bovis]